MPVTLDQVREFASGLPRTTEGVVHQRGTEINLRDNAFIKFADGKATRCGKTKPRSVSDGAVPRTPNPMRSPS